MSDTMITEAPAAAESAAAEASQVAAPAAVEGSEASASAAPAAQEAAAADNSAEAVADKPAGAPEKYEAFTAPEGASLDASIMGQFEEAAREAGLPQDKAQKFIDKMAPAMAKQQAEQIQQMRTEWATQSTADKEFGGDKLQENLGFARKAMDSFATPELKAILNESGLGNHPEVVRFMVRAGKAIGEDKIITGGTPNASKSAAQILFPKG